jgi:Na+/H+-dicarboxylate symporter
MMKMIELVLWISPLGVFCLLAWTVARIGLGVFAESIGSYMLTVILGLSFHACVVLPFLLYFFARVNPFHFFLKMKTALLMAFSTSSSVATLPVSIDCATNEGGVSKRVAGLVLPLGATINMDGTALYEAVAVVFLAQASGIDLSFVQLAIIALTATLAAIGAAGIPSAGLVTMFIVVDAVNHSLAAAGPGAQLIPVAAIGLIIGVDRLLDMFRTAVNVWGDAIGARLVTAFDQRFTGSVRASHHLPDYH